MKSPIPAIPTKTLNIEGRDYTVYKLVGMYFPGQQTALMANFSGKKYQRYLWKCSRIPNLRQTETHLRVQNLREAEIHLRVQDCIEYLHSKIEQEYLGDRFRYAKSESKYSLHVHQGYLIVRYNHYTEPGVPSTQVQKLVGRSSSVTQAEIDARVAEAVHHQRVMNTRYNKLLEQKHKAFRELVEQQLRERQV